MIEIKLKQCCYKCDYSDIQVDSRKKLSFLEANDITHCTIYCAHSKVCKKYLESEED